MAFRGWRAEAIEFFEGLEADNSKAYWQAHKDVYERRSARRWRRLLAELEPDYGDGKIFRPYRDVRFSADKSPYKTNIAATIGRRYVQLNADAFGVGCGRWEMSSEDLERYREAVDDDRSGRELVKLVEAGSTAGLEISGPRGAQDRSAWLSEGSSSDRTPALQGSDRLA